MKRKNSPEVEEFLDVIQIPCDVCGDIYCDGFCIDEIDGEVEV